jgi:hypothetical protein
MHRGLPCSGETTGSGSTTLTSPPEPTSDCSPLEACSTKSTSSKAGTTREYDMLQHDVMINMMLDDDMINNLSTTFLHGTATNQQNSLTNRNHTKQHYYFIKTC